YSGHDYSDTKIDEHPRPIQAHWGGLTSVALAYVADQKTYLFEKADLDGNFRYVCYSSPDYNQPDPGFPQTANMDFWQIPASYRLESLDAVTAVLFDADNMFLISRDQYIQYNRKTDLWSYP